MADLTLYTVDGAEFDIGLGTLSGTIAGLVSGISGDPATAIDQVVAACTAAGFPFGKAGAVAGGSATLQRIAGRATSSDTFRVQLTFGNAAGGTPTAYVITSRAYTQPYQSNRIPGTREPLRVPAWVPQLKPGETGPPGGGVPADYAMATWQYPMREITVSGLKYGTPPDDNVYAGQMGMCNREKFLGLGPGYWYVSNAETVQSVYSGYYTYTASATTKTIEDWSELFTLYSQTLNKYVDLDPDVDKRVRTAKYKPGIIDSGPGILRVGPFELTSFRDLFGFTSSPGGGTADFLNNPLTGGGSHQ